MFANLVANTEIVAFPIAGLVLFFGFMVAVYAWAFWPARQAHYRDVAASILHDEPADKRSKDCHGK